MATLLIRSDVGAETFAIEAPVVTVGRGLESDIRIKDIKSSRRHCQIVRNGTAYKLVDLGSGNGTYLNGVQVREQVLKNDDQIQIGTTVLVFSEGVASGSLAPTRSASPTDQERKVASVATGRFPNVSPATERTTARPAARPTAVTRKLAPPGPRTTTKAAAASSAGPAGKTTRSVPTTRATTRRGTGRVTTVRGTKRMSERFHAEASKKKVNPLYLIVGGAAAAVVAVLIAVLVFSGGGDAAFVREQVRELSAKGHKAFEADQYEEAVEHYRKAIAKCGEYPQELAGEKGTLEKAIERAQQHIKDREEGGRRWAGLKADFDGNKVDAAELFERARKLRDRFQPIRLPWNIVPPGEPLSEIDKMIERLGHILKTEAGERRKLSFQMARNRINRTHLERGSEDFAAALKAWGEYLANTKVGADDKNKAKNEIRRINREALGSWDTLRKRSERVGKEAALRSLRDLLPRFEGCEYNNRRISTEIRAKIKELGG